MKLKNNQQVERVEKQIGDLIFHVPLLHLRQQRRILFKIAGVAGVPLAELLGEELAESKGTKKETKGEEALVNGLKTALCSFGEDKTLDAYEWTLDQFIKDAKVSYRHEETGEMAEPFLRDVYEEVMNQRLDLEGQFLWACVEANYAPFLERVRAALKARLALRALAKAAQPSS